MAKKENTSAGQAGNGSGKGETIAGYFRKIFAEKPNLLGEKSNKELLSRWLRDHPGQTEVPKSVRANLANLKSVLRSRKRSKVAKRADGNQLVEKGMKAKILTVPTGASALESLEHQIDECLISAKVLDRDGLSNVIDCLRRARNLVVWRIGQ
jgi:hypothetical protein